MAAQTSGSHEIKLPENISTMTVEVLEDLLSRLRHIEAQIEDELRKKGKDGDCSLQQKATAGADDITALQQKVTVGADDIASLQKKVTAGADDIAKQGHISKQGLESIRIAVQLVNEDLPRRRRFSYYSAQRCKSFLLKILSSCGPDAFMLCAIFVGKDRIGKMRKSDKDELLAFFARNHTSLASSNLRKLRFHLPLDLGSCSHFTANMCGADDVQAVAKRRYIRMQSKKCVQSTYMVWSSECYLTSSRISDMQRVGCVCLGGRMNRSHPDSCLRMKPGEVERSRLLWRCLSACARSFLETVPSSAPISSDRRTAHPADRIVYSSPQAVLPQ